MAEMNKKELLEIIKRLTEYRALPDYESHFDLNDEKEYDKYFGDKERVIDVDLLLKELK